MAEELKRVGIKITADGAEDFKGSLKEISAVMKDNRAELKLAQSQYDKNTSVTQKLTDKQKYLTQQCAAYEDKLKILNAQLEAEKNKEDADTAAIRKKEAEIKEVQAQLNGYKNSLEDVNKQLSLHSAQLKEWGDQLQGIGDKVTGFGTTLTTHVTAPIAAVGAAGIAAFKEVDAAMDTVITKTGATGDALEAMQDSVKDLATSIPTDFDTAAAAVGEVHTRFELTGEELEELSGKFIKFAEINKTDVSSSVDSVQAAMAAFDVETESAGDVLDIFNKVGQDTGVSMDKLAADLTANAVPLQELGFGINSAAGFLANLNKNGIDSSAVLGGLKKALQNAAKDGKTMDEAMAELQESMKAAETDTEAMQLAMELFGNKAGPAIAQAVSEGRLSFDEMANSVLDWGDSVEATFDATLDPIDEFTTLSNEAKLGLADLGEQIQVAALPLMKKLGEGIHKVSQWFQNLSDDQKQAIVKIAAVVAAIGPLVVVLGTVISSIGGIITAVGAAMPVIGGIVTLLTGPVGLAIAGAVAAGVLLYKNWDTIKAKAGEMAEVAKAKFEEMKAAASEKFEAIKTTVTNIMDSAKKFVSDGIEKIKGRFNFEWKWPKLKMPHFSIAGEFSLSPPSVPHLAVEWYAKAMQNGMILDRPTIFGASGNRLLGGGEAGPEVVVGASSLYDMIRSAVSGDTNISQGGTVINVYGAPGQDVHELAQIVADVINEDVRSKAAVYT